MAVTVGVSGQDGAAHPTQVSLRPPQSRPYRRFGIADLDSHMARLVRERRSEVELDGKFFPLHDQACDLQRPER